MSRRQLSIVNCHQMEESGMKRKIKTPARFNFLLGFVIGALLFGGTAAVAVGIVAQPKTAIVVIDGNPVDLKGYIIEDSHYFQLRDLSSALAPGCKDFGITWDGANNRVLIDTAKRYDPNETIQAPPPEQEPDQKHEREQEPERERIPEQAHVDGDSISISDMKTELIRLTNNERAKAGLTELQILPELMDCAQLKAEDMIDNRYYGHNSPVYGSANEMIKALVPNARAGGENIAHWREALEEVFAGWMESPEHRANILSPRYTHIGIGIAQGPNARIQGGYSRWVQQFAIL